MKTLTQRIIGKTRAASQVHNARARIHKLAREIFLLRDSEIASRLDIQYDTSTSPPTYGNFMEVVMLCRYLIEEGYEVRFELMDDPEKRRQDWSNLEPAQQQELLMEFNTIANKLIPAPLHKRLAPSHGWQPSTKVTWYQVSPYLLHLLYKRSNPARSNSFLLTMNDFAVNSPHTSIYEPYIAWHIRHNLLWGKDRNSTRSSIISDFLTLEKAFPERAIVILSTPGGVSMALDVLAQEGFTSEKRKGGAGVRGQKKIGFLETIPVALGAEFYFQRLGGGMGIGPIFSSLPYLILSNTKSYYFNHTGTKLVSWATSAQRYVVRKDAGSLGIEGNLPPRKPDGRHGAYLTQKGDIGSGLN